MAGLNSHFKQLVILALASLADEDLSREERDLMVENLIKVEVPEEFFQGKTNPPKTVPTDKPS